MTDIQIRIERYATTEKEYEEVMELIHGYIAEEYNNLVLHSKLLDYYNGNEINANKVMWEIADWEKAENDQ